MSEMCPHQSQESLLAYRCELLEKFGIAYIPGPKRSGYPCETCKSQWVDGSPPTLEKLTPKLAEIINRKGAMPPTTLTEKAIGFIKAKATHILAGLPMVSTQQCEQRKRVCRANTCQQYQVDGDNCGVCGCPIEEIAPMATKTCPVNEWVSVDATFRVIVQPEIIQSNKKCRTCD